MSKSEINQVPPIFMFGFERSGTTLLSMMVGAHPQIAVPLSVTGLWYRYDRMLDKYNGLQNKSDVEHIIDDLLQEERISLWDVEFDRNELLAGIESYRFSDVIARFHFLYAKYKGKTIWGNLDIATLDDMDSANNWFPNARFIHIARDGRDIALSHQTMPYGAANIAECAEKWVHRVKVNLKMGAILGKKRYLLVRYEDLVLQSETTLRQICGFIGIPYSAKMLEYPEMVEKKIPENRRWLWPALNKAPDKTKVYRWKSNMSSIERIVFENTANTLLNELGYEAFSKIPKRLRAYLLELWYFLGRGHRFQRFAEILGIRRHSQLERKWQKRKKSGKRKPNYNEVQQQVFGNLIEQGIYSTNLNHSDQAKSFFTESMQYALAKLDTSKKLSILDCGCGTGAWLDFLHKMVLSKKVEEKCYYGFDLTPAMIDIARKKLSKYVPPDHFKEGDILKEDSYAFNGSNQKFDLIYTYDVIQQLPRRLQLTAFQAMFSRLAPGGVTVVFDHDKDSSYGRKMGWKKFVTRYLKIKLVPEFYCNARYPALGKLSRQIADMDLFSTVIRLAPDGGKRALIIHSK